MLSHRNMIATAEAFVEVNDVKAGDNWLSYLPMAWVGDAAFTLCMALVARLTVNCPENPETVQRDLRELGPDSMLAPPRIWENMLTLMQIKGSDASPIKRRVFEHFRSLAERCELKRSDGKVLSLADRWGLALGEVLVYGPVRDQLGLRKARWCYTGGAPLGPDTYRFFRSFGINLKQVYGATEASALIACQADAEANPNTVGRPIPHVEVKIDDRGEVLLKGPNVFKGYFKQDEVTRDTVTADGWLKTGDAGFRDAQGYVFVHDRVKDMIVSGGENVYPAEVENAILGCPGVADAAVIGVPDERWGEAVKAIVVPVAGAEPAPADVIAWARQRIAGYKAPKSVDFIEALPRNASGKVLRRELRKPYWEGRDRNVG